MLQLLSWQPDLANTGTQTQMSKLSKMSEKIYVSNKTGKALRSFHSHMEVSWSSTANGQPYQMDLDVEIDILYTTQ